MDNIRPNLEVSNLISGPLAPKAILRFFLKVVLRVNYDNALEQSSSRHDDDDN